MYITPVITGIANDNIYCGNSSLVVCPCDSCGFVSGYPFHFTPYIYNQFIHSYVLRNWTVMKGLSN
jgi:hypothetical protein